MSDDEQTFQQHFAELDEVLRQHLSGTGLAEVHGMATAMACAGSAGDGLWPGLLGDIAEREDIARVLASVSALATGALRTDAFGFRPLLPDDDAPVQVQVEAVSDWCSGFVQAFPLTGARPDGSEAGEALEDIRALAGMEVDDDDERSQRRNLVEIHEYLRVATQLLHDGIHRPAAPEPRTTNKPE